MVSINKLLSNQSFSLFISVLLGFGLASIFRKACNNRSCLVVQTIPTKKLIGKKLKREGKCYQWTPKTVKTN
tara:strand:- start:78 stop:293 length:216 start_codon:yes stop_codon:yes gene_type:complete